MNDVLTASEDVYLLTAVEAADDVICTAVMEANCRADAAVGASNTLWQYVLVLESQRDQYYHNWQEAVGQLHASIAKNRNIEPAVVENLLLQRKIAELEGRLAQYESKQGHPTQNEGSHRERQETSNKGSSHSQEDNTGTPSAGNVKPG